MAQNAPESADSLLEAGLRALDAGRYTDALESWNRVLELDPSNTRAADLVGQLSDLIRDRDVGQLTPMSGEFVVVVDDDDESAASTPLPRAVIGSDVAGPQVIARGALERLQRLLDTHEEQNAALNNQIATLESELLSARQQLQNCERSLLSERERTLHLEKDTAGFAAKRRDQERVERQRARQLAELEHLVEEQREQARQAEETIGAVQRDLVSTKANLEIAASEAASASARLDDAVQARDGALLQVEQLRDELVEQRHALASEQATVEELREELATRGRESAAAAAQAKAAEERARENAAKLQAERDKAVNELERSNTELSAAKAEHEASRTENRSLQQQLDSTTTALAASRASAVKLESALDALTAKISKETSELRERLSAKGDEVARLSSLVSEMERAQPSGAELSAALDEAIRRAEAAEELAKAHEERANASDVRVHELSQEIAQLSRRLSEVDDSDPQFITGSHRVASKRPTQHTPLESRAVTNSYDSVEQALAESEAFAEAHNAKAAASPNDTQPGFDDEREALEGQVDQTLRARPGAVVSTGTLIGHVGDDLLGVELGIRSATPAGGIEDPISEVARSRASSTATHAVVEETAIDFRPAIDDGLSNPELSNPALGEMDADDAADQIVEFEITGPQEIVASAEFDITGSAAAAEEAVEFRITGDHDEASEDADDAASVEFRVTGDHDASDEGEEIVFELDDHAPEADHLGVREEDIDDLDHADGRHVDGAALDRDALDVEYTDGEDTEGDEINFDLDDDEFADTEGELSAIDANSAHVSERFGETQPSGPHALHLLDESLTPHERLSWVIDETPQRMVDVLGLGQEIDSQAAFVLQLIDGTVTFADVIDIVGLPTEDTSRILVDLLRRRIISTPSATL